MYILTNLPADVWHGAIAGGVVALLGVLVVSVILAAANSPVGMGGSTTFTSIFIKGLLIYVLPGIVGGGLLGHLGIPWLIVGHIIGALYVGIYIWHRRRK